MINEVLPVLILITGALLILGGTKLARRFGLPDAFGCGVALCIIAISVWLFPANWREWWAGGLRGDRLLTYARLVGLTGMFFLAGTRFDVAWLRNKMTSIPLFALSAGVLFVAVLLTLKLLGSIEWGPTVLVSATVVATSLWFPTTVARADNELTTNWQAAAVALTAIGILALYFFDAFAAIKQSRLGASVYAIVGSFEAVKLAVLFGFAYFITSRFLTKAEGRISKTRTTIGFALIAILIFALAATTTNQLGAIAWAFIAGTIWRRSSVGKRFTEGERPIASALLLSMVFLPLLLQSHGRLVTGYLPLIVGLLAAIGSKALVVWVAARASGLSSQHAMHTAVAMVGAGELAILLLGFGLSRWVIEPAVYFGVLTYAFASSVLIPLAGHFVLRTHREGRLRRREMRNQMKQVPYVVIILLATIFFYSGAGLAQQPSRDSSRQEVQLGTGMSVITPGLMEIGSKTRLFLVFADKISLKAEQQKRLEDLYFHIQMYSFQREADLDVADAEFKRLLTRDTVDLSAVRAKMREIETIRVEVDMKKIETLLLAINVLTHGQHMQIVLLARDLEQAAKPRAPIY